MDRPLNLAEEAAESVNPREQGLPASDTLLSLSEARAKFQLSQMKRY